MPRSVVIRTGGSEEERVIDEVAVPTEAALHEVLMRHPQLVPATDLGLGAMVTVGFEATLASGNADLVLLDESGHLCLVEVKKEGNPDTRRVVAQLLDYAAALWGLSLSEFEQRVLKPGPGDIDKRSLTDFLTEEFPTGEDEDPEDHVAQIIDGLSESLRSGDFTLVVAAPVIPEGVQRVIEYLNARGLSVYGLEVSYFAGAVEAFVPRIVVRPTLSGRIAGQDSHETTGRAVDAESSRQRIPEQFRDAVDGFLARVEEVGAEVQWRDYGPRVRVRGTSGPRVVWQCDSGTTYLVVSELEGLSHDAAIHAVSRLRAQVPAASTGKTYAKLGWTRADPESLANFLQISFEFVQESSTGSSPMTSQSRQHDPQPPTLADMGFAVQDECDQTPAGWRFLAAGAPFLIPSPNGMQLRGTRYCVATDPAAEKETDRFIACEITKGYASGGKDGHLTLIRRAANLETAVQSTNTALHRLVNDDEAFSTDIGQDDPAPLDVHAINAAVDRGKPLIIGAWKTTDLHARRLHKDPTVAWASPEQHVLLWYAGQETDRD